MNWNLPNLTSLYTDALTLIKERTEENATMFRNSSSTNLPDGSIKWSETNNRFESYNASGSNWVELSSIYEVQSRSATQLTTSRSFDITGDITADAQTFNGTGNVSINASVNNDSHSHTNATITGVETSTASTVVQRDINGDINARLFRSEYDSTNSSVNFIMTQVDTASNNYIRPSTPLQVANSLASSLFAVGMIMMWSGSSSNVPDGWALCDGNNGTPNLMGRFIRGATTSGGTGGYADATLVSHSHSFSGTTSSNGEHNHTGYSNLNLMYAGGGGRPNDAPNGYATSGRQWQTLYGGSHNHSFSGGTSTVGDSATDKNLPPYYELCYIMKV